VGKEIICYHNEHDLAEKIKYFTAHTTERDRIARAGYEKSLQSHTWQKRFTDFFNYLKL
jgi:spore maturation protein CgeB